MKKNKQHSTLFNMYDTVRRKLNHYYCCLEIAHKSYYDPEDPCNLYTREQFVANKLAVIEDLKFTINELRKESKQLKKDICFTQYKFSKGQI